MALLDIKEVRPGRLPTDEKIRKRVEKLRPITPEQCFTVVVGRHLMEVSFINLVAASGVMADNWVVGLRSISRSASRAFVDPTTVWLKRNYLRLLDEKVASVHLHMLREVFGKSHKKAVDSVLEGA